MSEAEARKDEGKELVEFATSTVRGPKKGVFQQLLGQHLIMAVSSLSPKKERLVCEASMMLNEEQTKKAEIDACMTVMRTFFHSSARGLCLRYK